MRDEKHTWEKFHSFWGPLIMSEGKYYEYLHDLQKQIEELANIDAGLAQTCHCSEPCGCEEQRQYWTTERNWLAANIRKALMI